MALQEKLMDDLKAVMKKGDKVRLSTLRMLRAKIKNAEIDQGSTLDDAAVVQVIAKDIKQHKESITAFRDGNRPDLVAKEEAEMAILLEYMPEQISRDEIIAIAKKVMAEVGATGPHDKGKVMGKLMAQLRGKADGQEINMIVSELLTGS